MEISQENLYVDIWEQRAKESDIAKIDLNFLSSTWISTCDLS